MAIPRPIGRWNFAETPFHLDPRWSVSRASTARHVDVTGFLNTVPNNVLRHEFEPLTRKSLGVLLELSRTNLLLYSSDLTQAAWVKSSATITANTGVGPIGGAADLDTITVNAASGFVYQSATITAGHSLTFSFFARAGVSNWCYASFNDGTNVLVAWFNISGGVVGTKTIDTGTIVFSDYDVENYGNGLYRCWLTVTTNTSTSMSVTIAPCAADGVSSANTDAAAFGEFQLETASGGCDPSAPIPTSAATVTRATEGLTMPVSSIPGWNLSEGTMLFEISTHRKRSTGSRVYGGIGDTFSNTYYLTWTSGAVYLTGISGGASQVLSNRSVTKTLGGKFRAAFRWKLNDVALCVNGGTVTVDSSALVPASVVRIGVGTAPWASTGSGPGEPISMCALWNVALNNAELQAITSPSPI